MFKKSMAVKKQSDEKEKLSLNAITLLLAVVFVVMFVFSSCKDDEPTGPELQKVVDVVISPDSAEFRLGEQMQFSAFVITEDGDTIATEDLEEWEGEWWSSDTDVFTVEENGLATGQESGEAFCVVEIEVGDVQIATKAGFLTKGLGARFTGRDSAIVFVF